MSVLYTITALLPFALLVLLMAVLKKPAIFSIPVTLSATVLSIYFVWEMNPLWMAASLVKGLFVSIDIIYIIFSAVFLLAILKKTNLFFVLTYLLNKVSKDKRVQAIIVGWFFVSFIEGVAGFGTPAMLAAPVLITLGFPKITSVVVALVGNSLSVTFGAVGMPVLVGLSQGLKSADPLLIADAFQGAALVHALAGFIIPLAIACMPPLLYKKSIKEGLAAWRYALMASVCFLVPFYLSAVFLGPEFPTIIGSLLGGAILVTLTTLKIGVPKKVWEMRGENTGKIEQVIKEEDKQFLSPKYILKISSPYIVIIAGLAASRINIFGLGEALVKFNLQITNIFGASIPHSFQVLYSPGFFILISALFAAAYFKISLKSTVLAAKEAARTISRPVIAIFSALGIMQILMHSSENASELPSVLTYLAQGAAGFEPAWPAAAAILGAMGAFVAGSATVSNLMFSELQFQTATLMQMSPALFLALQLVGSSSGNMISLQNIISASAVVGLKNKEGAILRIILPILAIYILTAIIIATMLIR